MARTANYENNWSYFDTPGTHIYNGSKSETVSLGYSDYYGRSTRSAVISYTYSSGSGTIKVVQPAKSEYANCSQINLGTEGNPKAIPSSGFTGHLLLETNKNFTTNGLILSYSLTYGTTMTIAASVKSYSDVQLENLTAVSGTANESITLSTCSADYGSDQRFTIKSAATIICPAYLNGGIHEQIMFKQSNNELGTTDIYIKNENKLLTGTNKTIYGNESSGTFSVTSNCIMTDLAYTCNVADLTNSNIPTWEFGLDKHLLNDTSNNFTTSAQNISFTTDHYYGNTDRTVSINAYIPGDSNSTLVSTITQSARSNYAYFENFNIETDSIIRELVEGESISSDNIVLLAHFITNEDTKNNSSYFKFYGMAASGIQYITEPGLDTSYFHFKDYTGNNLIHRDHINFVTSNGVKACTTLTSKNYGANTYYHIWIPLAFNASNVSTKVELFAYFNEDILASTYAYFKNSSVFNISAPTITTSGGAADVTITTEQSNWSLSISEE